jgi:hypothetical protein
MGRKTLKGGALESDTGRTAATLPIFEDFSNFPGKGDRIFGNAQSEPGAAKKKMARRSSGP